MLFVNTFGIQLKKGCFDTYFDTKKIKQMGTINFYLKNPDKKGQSPIFLTYQKKGQKFRYFTKLKIPASCWTGSRAKVNSIGYAEINGILEDIENTLKEIEREAIFKKKEYSIEIIKKKFFSIFGSLNNTNDFFSLFNKFISDSKPTKAATTVKAYIGTRNTLLKFATAKNINITFESIDYAFYESFINYMLKDLKHLNNTAGKNIKCLKVFLNYAVDHELTTQDYNLKKFKVFNDEADTIYLTEKEVMAIYRKEDFEKRLLPVKDIFCFACFTGLRFSDINKLDNTHIKGNYLEIKTEKTKDSVRVPLNDFAKAILNKYKNKFKEKPLPTGLTNQKTNAYLKEIAEDAEITESIRIEQFNGSNRIVTIKKKFELVTTHTARRTFVTLTLEKGIRAEVVMAMTGHRSYRSFQKYVKITDKVMENEMNKAWNTPLLRAV